MLDTLSRAIGLIQQWISFNPYISAPGTKDLKVNQVLLI